jgi:hypothetical protein
MTFKSFEDYLQYKHSQNNPEVLDDMLPDDYERWLEDIGIEGIIEYADKYADIYAKDYYNDLLKK